LRLENPHEAEFLDAEAEAGLHLDHLHKRFLLGLVVDRDAFSLATARDDATLAPRRTRSSTKSSQLFHQSVITILDNGQTAVNFAGPAAGFSFFRT
jgi:hypothetical protein